MNANFNVSAESAFITGSWSEDLRVALETYRPPHLELVGDWADLSKFEGVADYVRSLKIAGSTKNGEIKAARGLHLFSKLERLTLASRSKDGFDVSCLSSLEEIDAFWQSDVREALALPSLRNATIRSFPDSDLSALPASESIAGLWLSYPAITSLAGLGAFSGLAELRISDARRLERLDGIQHDNLTVLDIENARKLVDLGAISNARGLQRLRLLSIAETVDLMCIANLRQMRTLHVGGKGVPAIDWIAVASLPYLEKAFGWWDPAQVAEEKIRGAIGPARRLDKFDPVGSRGKRPLLIEVADSA